MAEHSPGNPPAEQGRIPPSDTNDCLQVPVWLVAILAKPESFRSWTGVRSRFRGSPTRRGDRPSPF